MMATRYKYKLCFCSGNVILFECSAGYARDFKYKIEQDDRATFWITPGDGRHILVNPELLEAVYETIEEEKKE
jgi:hypothetical protein